MKSNEEAGPSKQKHIMKKQWLVNTQWVKTCLSFIHSKNIVEFH